MKYHMLIVLYFVSNFAFSQKSEILITNNSNFPESYFNWNDFFYYSSMEGLHHIQVFNDEIGSDAVKYFIYSFYVTIGRALSKS